MPLNAIKHYIHLNQAGYIEYLQMTSPFLGRIRMDSTVRFCEVWHRKMMKNVTIDYRRTIEKDDISSFELYKNVTISSFIT